MIICENCFYSLVTSLMVSLPSCCLLHLWYVLPQTPLSSLYILQHHVFSSLDKAHIPDVIRTLSVLHNINWPPFIISCSCTSSANYKHTYAILSCYIYLVYWHTLSTLNSFNIIIMIKYNSVNSQLSIVPNIIQLWTECFIVNIQSPFRAVPCALLGSWTVIVRQTNFQQNGVI